ncbi:hypothetical protein [Clostridium tertium]|nr:hypothetical protein [Clostridium tertium]MDY4605462.1 hypothetical protein [Clostridium tertium]
MLLGKFNKFNYKNEEELGIRRKTTQAPQVISTYVPTAQLE